MAKPWTLYDILDVDRRASTEEIASACRSILMRLHPDRTRTGQRVGQLYEFVVYIQGKLTDPEARAEYDAQLRAATSAPGPHAAPKPTPGSNANQGRSDADRGRDASAPKSNPIIDDLRDAGAAGLEAAAEKLRESVKRWVPWL